MLSVCGVAPCVAMCSPHLSQHLPHLGSHTPLASVPSKLSKAVPQVRQLVGLRHFVKHSWHLSANAPFPMAFLHVLQ